MPAVGVVHKTIISAILLLNVLMFDICVLQFVLQYQCNYSRMTQFTIKLILVLT